jgi:hypothetical protein
MARHVEAAPHGFITTAISERADERRAKLSSIFARFHFFARFAIRARLPQQKSDRQTLAVL